MNKKLIYLYAQVYNDNKLQQILRQDPELKCVDLNKATKYYDELDCQVVTIFEPQYPKKLKLLKSPPWVLFYLGNLSHINNYLISIIGTRTPSRYAVLATADLIKNFSSKKTILVGYGLGISKQACESAINNEHNIVSFAAKNLTMCKKNNPTLFNGLITSGLIMTEVPPGKLPNVNCFNKRNKIIAVLSNEVNVIESNENGLAIEIANQAKSYGSIINALPGNIYEPANLGNYSLLNDGANIIYINNKI